MATLDQLVSVRSQLALGLEAYLRSFVDLTVWPPSPFLGGRLLIDMYLPPEVVRKGGALDAERVEREQGLEGRGKCVYAVSVLAGTRSGGREAE